MPATLLLGLCRLQHAILKLHGIRLDDTRVPDAPAKQLILTAVSRAARAMPLVVALRTVGLSASRFHGWQQQSERKCLLDDRASCPRTHPTQLTPDELATMKELVFDPALRHMPVRTLALHSQRIQKLFAHESTWRRVIRDRGWKRPRHRVYPAKPKVGIRATSPNEYWHIDATIMRLLDGSRVYLHAVIDNYSRRILAWKAWPHLDPITTYEILQESLRGLPPGTLPPTVVADSGGENVNAVVDDLVGKGLLKRILAQVEVVFSNSMIEAFWQSSKKNCFYVNPLTDFDTFVKLATFYVPQHNQVMPHSAFVGQTPDEMYFGTGTAVPAVLAAARLAARTARLARNRQLRCGACIPSIGVRLLLARNPPHPQDPLIPSVVALATG